MIIRIGDKIPDATLRILDEKAQQNISSVAYFANRNIVLFAVPGAFTPTCSISHLPGFVENAQKFFDKGIDAIACMSVNDAFVMSAWGKSANADQLDMLADGNGEFSAALGLEQDSIAFGMGIRSRRFALIAKDGIIIDLLVEEPGEFRVSTAEHVLGRI